MERRKHLGLSSAESVTMTTLLKYRSCVDHDLEIKYFCKNEAQGLCTDCIASHASHDFVFADQEASDLVYF